MRPTRPAAAALAAAFAALSVAFAPPVGAPEGTVAIGAPVAAVSSAHTAAPSAAPPVAADAQPVSAPALDTETAATAEPDPAPAPPPDEDPGTGDLTTRVHAAFANAIPPRWQPLATELTVVGGHSSYAWFEGRVQIGGYHASGPWDYLRTVIAHELGHVIAFRFGDVAYDGEAPAGFPYTGTSPEVWANCVAVAFTGSEAGRLSDRAHCSAEQAAWTAEWLSTH